MKCPNCSFNNVAKAPQCKICGTKLDIIESENTDTLSLDEALKAIFAGKAKASLLTEDATDDEVESGETDLQNPPAWEPLNDELSTPKKSASPLPNAPTADAPTTNLGDQSIGGSTAPFFKMTGSGEQHSPDDKKQQKKKIVPVYELGDHSINMEDDAENLLSLPMDDDIKNFAPQKRRASKLDEIAGIAVILLIIILIALIIFAIWTGKKDKQPPTEPTILVTNTTGAATDTSPVPPTTSSSTETTTSAASKTATTSTTETTPATTAFDEWYFVKQGSVSNGDGTDEDSLSKIRMGDHYYFHRLVFDFLGSKIPTYTVSILEGGYLVQLHVENITSYTSETAVASWSNIAESIEIIADTPTSINVNIRMSEPVMISTYGLEEPGRIIIDIRGDSNLD